MNLENIVKKSQKRLKEALTVELQKMDYTVKDAQGYLYAEGELPVLLVAHLDTVHKQRVENICYSKDGTLMMSPEGIGGDDRAGVYMILEIINHCRCHVLFCEDEEIGGVGARKFTKSKIKPKISYIIEMDRQSGNDAVFYDCDNPDFTEFICGFGFEKAHGSFSDISVIAPYLGVAAVNISAGYYFAHSRFEYINLEEMQNNIERIAQMVQTPAAKFRYIEKKHTYAQFRMENACWSLFDEPEKESELQLMPLPDSAYLRKDGQITEAGSSYLMDNTGAVYDFISALDAAVKLDNTSAHSSSDMPLRFIKDQSRTVRVIPIETAWEQMNLYGGKEAS